MLLEFINYLEALAGICCYRCTDPAQLLSSISSLYAKLRGTCKKCFAYKRVVLNFLNQKKNELIFLQCQTIPVETFCKVMLFPLSHKQNSLKWIEIYIVFYFNWAKVSFWQVQTKLLCHFHLFQKGVIKLTSMYSERASLNIWSRRRRPAGLWLVQVESVAGSRRLHSAVGWNECQGFLISTVRSTGSEPPRRGWRPCSPS